MDAENSKVRDFNKEAIFWDKPQRVKRTQEIVCSVLKEIPLSSSTRVVDFGCGTGLLSIGVCEKAESVTGIDTSEKMIEIFNQKILNQNLKNIKTLHISGFEAKDIPDISCDVVMSAMTMHHICSDNIKSYVKKFFDMITPGGYIAVADLDEENGKFHSDNEGVFHFGFSRKHFKNFLAVAGFENIKDVTASEIIKPDSVGGTNKFTVFLITGQKPLK